MDLKLILACFVTLTINATSAKPTPEELLRGVFITDETLKRLQERAQQNDNLRNQAISTTPNVQTAPVDQTLIKTNVPLQTTQTQQLDVAQPAITNSPQTVLTNQQSNNQQPVLVSLQPSQSSQQAIVVNQQTPLNTQQTSPNSQQQVAVTNQQPGLVTFQPTTPNQQTHQQPILLNVQPNSLNQQQLANNQQVLVQLQPATSNQQAVLLNQQQLGTNNQRPIFVTLQPSSSNYQPVLANQQPVYVQPPQTNQQPILVAQQPNQIVTNLGQMATRPTNSNSSPVYALLPVNQNNVQGSSLGSNTVLIPVQQGATSSGQIFTLGT